ncbi:MAG: hypothetical protein EKE20_10460 [Candidatus Symbiopectobacterium sp. Dall1.0]|nr:hypothetical protein [Candidatus Symbiopectobacterium sp. Dall1.0]
MSGEFNIIASVLYPSVITNNTTVTFKEKSNYYISAEIAKDGAIANGADYNIIYFTVYDSNTNTPVKNQLLYVAFTGSINYPPTISTSTNGSAILTITSEISGSFDGTVVLASDASVTYSFITKFTSDVNVYPKFMGTETVWYNGYMPISDFLSNYDLVFGHVYRIEFSRTRTSVHNCSANYVFDKAKNKCVTTYPENLQFYNTELTHFRVLASGLGSLFHSKRYYYYNSQNTGYGTVSVWDYGYSPTSADEQPLRSFADGEENSNTEDTEPFNDE